MKLILDSHPAATQATMLDDGLALHVALGFHASEAMVKLVFDAHPAAVQWKMHGGSLPLHFALEHNASEATVKLIFDAYPDAVRVQKQDGRTPADLGKGSTRALLLLATRRHSDLLVEPWEAVQRAFCLAYTTASYGVLGTVSEAVALAAHCQAKARRMAETDEEKGEEALLLGQRAQQVASALLEETLGAEEQEQLFASKEGTQLMEAAVQANCQLLLGRPRIQQMLRRWWWPAASAEPVALVEQVKAAAVGVFALFVSLSVLPLLAVAPPLEDAAMRLFARRRRAAVDAVQLDYVQEGY